MRAAGTVCLLLFLVVGNTYCQSDDLVFKDQPLSAILESIKEKYDVNFSYADGVIADKHISVQLDGTTDVDEFLQIAESLTKLRFEKVSDQYIVIRPFENEDKITICGYLIDSDQAPILGATISLAGTGKGAISDARGYFQVHDVPFSEIVSISFLGFETKNLQASDLLGTDCLSIILTESVEYLDEVIINDYIIKGTIKKNRKIELELKNLNMLPGLVEPDVLRSLQLVPGVNSPFETATGIYIRGGAPDQNLVLWNGIKTYDQGHFFGMLSAFNPYTIQKVDFIKNGTSAVYGDRVSGVIDIQTNQEVVNKVEGGAGFDMIYADANLKIPIISDKLSIQASARRSYTDWIQTFTYDQLSERVFQNTKISDESTLNNSGTNDFFFNDINVDVIAKPSQKDKLMVSTFFAENDLDFSSSSADGQQSFNDLLRALSNGYNLKWKRQHNDQFSIAADAYFSQYLLDYEFRTTTNDTTETSTKKNLVSDLGFGLNGEWRFKNQSRLLSGYQFSNNNIEYAFETRTPSYFLVLDAAKNEINTHSAYAEYQIDASPKTYVSTGLRFNYYTGIEESFLEPRIYVRHKLGSTISLNSSLEYRSQVVSQIQESVVSDLSLENQVWTLASTDQFPLIDSYQFTLGSNFTKDTWIVDLDTYAKKIDGITTLTFGFLNPIDNEYRVGNSRITGLDFFVKKKLSVYNTWLAYSFIRSENEFMGLNNDEPFPGNWNIEHTIKWSHFYRWKNLHLSLGWIWHTGKAFTEVSETPTATGPTGIQFEGINSQNLPVYHRLDFSAIYDFHSRNDKIKYRVGFSIQNLYDRKNLLNQELRTTPSLDNELISTNVYSLGFTPNLVFRVFW